MENNCKECLTPDLMAQPGASGTTASRGARPAPAAGKPGPARQKPSLPEWIAGLSQLPLRC